MIRACGERARFEHYAMTAASLLARLCTPDPKFLTLFLDRPTLRP